MPFVTAPDGTRIHYAVEGDGPPLVLQHGTGGSAATWHDTGYVERLRERFRLILVDSRGHGQSDRPADRAAYELRGRVIDIVTVLNALELRRAHLFGYSMGGWIAWGALIYQPQRFDRLVIGGFGPVPDPYFGRSFEQFLGPRLARMSEGDQAVLRAVFAETARFGGAEQVLRTTDQRLLLFAGDQDPRYVSIRDAAPRAQHAEFFALPGLDHAQALREAVDEVCERVVGFLEAP